MDATSRNLSFSSAGLVAALFLLALAAPACERSEESFRQIRNSQATRPPSEQTAELIKRLEGAKELDVSQANRPGVSAVAWEDYMDQAGKADKAIKELSDGFEVSQAELKDALWVPPASLSSDEKSRLISQVQQAIQHDQREEENIRVGSNMGKYPDPTTTIATLEEHKEMAESVLKDLETGEDVHWQTLNRAIQPVSEED